VLSDAELAEIWFACRGDDYGRIIRLLMLTGQRRDEVGAMAWPELDLERHTWWIGPARTKNGRPHMVPLGPGALAIVGSVQRRPGRDHLFGEGPGAFSGWSKAKAALDRRVLDARRKAVEKAGRSIEDVQPLAPWRLHDLRRTAATRMPEIGVLPHVVEAVLNHVSGHKAGVAGIYNRSTYEREVKAALALWSDHISGIANDGERKIAVFTRRNGAA